MNLLSVNMSVDPRRGGGCAVRMLQATRALADAGLRCAIATSSEPIDPPLREALQGVDMVRLPVTLGRFRLPVAGLGALRRAVERADVVLLFNHWTIINLLAARYCRRAGVPYIVCPAGALPREGGRSRLLKFAYNAMAGRRLVREAAAHMAVTTGERVAFAAYGVEPARVTVVPNAMTPLPPGDGARFRLAHGLDDAPLLLFVGRLAPIKGPDLLVRAFAQIAAARPAWRLVLAGPDDGMLRSLRALHDRLPIRDRVHFVGHVDDAAKADALAAAELVVVPSRREAMSIVVLEAAGASRPVVVTDQCGIPEVAAAGGWVTPATVEGLAEGLLQATGDRAALRERGVQWREAANARFGWPRIVSDYLAVITRAAAGRRSPG